MDVVALLEAVDKPEADLAFALKFTKARERTPGNRDDFEPMIITLIDDRWASEAGGGHAGKPRQIDRAFELLRDAITREGTVPPANDHVPQGTLCITEGLWRRYCKAGFILESDNDATFRSAFHRAAKQLLETGQIGKWDLWVWIVK